MKHFSSFFPWIFVQQIAPGKSAKLTEYMKSKTKKCLLYVVVVKLRSLTTIQPPPQHKIHDFLNFEPKYSS